MADYITCPTCKKRVQYEGVILGGYPHIVCCYCGAWIPLI